MTLISPKLTQIKGFTITGVSIRTQNSNEFNAKTAKLPTLWQQFHSSELATGETVFGVYSDYESDANGLYTVTVGIASDNKHDSFKSVTIQPGHYLVFENTGPIPNVVIETWRSIWDFFAINHTYQRHFISDFESYSRNGEVAIYIGITT